MANLVISHALAGRLINTMALARCGGVVRRVSRFNGLLRWLTNCRNSFPVESASFHRAKATVLMTGSVQVYPSLSTSSFFKNFGCGFAGFAGFAALGNMQAKCF